MSKKPLFDLEDLLVPSGNTASYAVPKMVTSARGTIVLFCHQRFESNKDFGYPKDGLMIRSRDNGETWSEVQRIAHVENMACRLLGAVADQETGKVFGFVKIMPLFNDRGERVESDWFIENEQKAREMGHIWCVIESDDDGESWSGMRDVTDQFLDHDIPNAGEFMPNMTGIQLRRGEWRGRLVVPSRVWMGRRKAPENYYNCVIYSDDHGATWKCGGLTQSHVGECAAVELSDGKLYVNNRNHSATQGIRNHAISHDGGLTFTEFGEDPELIEPTCHAAMVRYRDIDKDPEDVILFLNPASRSKRHRMTVRVSYDGCRTWPVSRLIDEGLSGYSSLAVGKDGTILCAYERGKKNAREKIALARVNMAWVKGGEA